MLSLAKLASMPTAERATALRRLTSSTPNGVRLTAEIHELERRYEMTSATMRARVRGGKLDTADTARWLVLLDALGR